MLIVRRVRLVETLSRQPDWQMMAFRGGRGVHIVRVCEHIVAELRPDWMVSCAEGRGMLRQAVLCAHMNGHHVSGILLAVQIVSSVSNRRRRTRHRTARPHPAILLSALAETSHACLSAPWGYCGARLRVNG